MNIKLVALRKTLGFFAIASILATAFVYATLWIPLHYIIYAVIAGLFGTGFWMMYEVNLQKLENEERSRK